MKTIAIDFDGTIVEQTVYPKLEYTFKTGAKEAVIELSKKGYRLVLNSARYGWYRIPAIWFIIKNRLPIEWHLFNHKPNADIYIDDKNIFCEEIEWDKITKRIISEE